MLEAFRVFQLAEQRKAVLPVARLRRGAARKRCRAERAQCRRRQRGGGGADDGPSSEFHAKILRRSRKAAHDAIAGDYVGFSVRHQRPGTSGIPAAVKFAWPNAATGLPITKRPGLARPRHEWIAALITSSVRL